MSPGPGPPAVPKAAWTEDPRAFDLGMRLSERSHFF